MPEDSKARINQEDEEEKVSIPDFIELWKQLYFQTEDSWANATKELIGSKQFISILDQIREQYLSFQEISKQNTDQFFKVNPLPSKKDIARIAELIIGLEDKVDDFDLHFSNNIASITKSLIKLVDYQESLIQEIRELKEENLALNKKLDNINRKVNAMARLQTGLKEAAAETDKKAKAARSKKKDSLD